MAAAAAAFVIRELSPSTIDALKQYYQKKGIDLHGLWTVLASLIQESATGKSAHGDPPVEPLIELINARIKLLRSLIAAARVFAKRENQVGFEARKGNAASGVKRRKVGDDDDEEEEYEFDESDFAADLTELAVVEPAQMGPAVDLLREVPPELRHIIVQMIANDPQVYGNLTTADRAFQLMRGALPGVHATGSGGAISTAKRLEANSVSGVQSTDSLDPGWKILDCKIERLSDWVSYEYCETLTCDLQDMNEIFASNQTGVRDLFRQVAVALRIGEDSIDEPRRRAAFDAFAVFRSWAAARRLQYPELRHFTTSNPFFLWILSQAHVPLLESLRCKWKIMFQFDPIPQLIYTAFPKVTKLDVASVHYLNQDLAKRLTSLRIRLNSPEDAAKFMELRFPALLELCVFTGGPVRLRRGFCDRLQSLEVVLFTTGPWGVSIEAPFENLRRVEASTEFFFRSTVGGISDVQFITGLHLQPNLEHLYLNGNVNYVHEAAYTFPSLRVLHVASRDVQWQPGARQTPSLEILRVSGLNVPVSLIDAATGAFKLRVLDLEFLHLHPARSQTFKFADSICELHMSSGVELVAPQPMVKRVLYKVNHYHDELVSLKAQAEIFTGLKELALSHAPAISNAAHALTPPVFAAENGLNFARVERLALYDMPVSVSPTVFPVVGAVAFFLTRNKVITDLFSSPAREYMHLREISVLYTTDVTNHVQLYNSLRKAFPAVYVRFERILPRYTPNFSQFVDRSFGPSAFIDQEWQGMPIAQNDAVMADAMDEIPANLEPVAPEPGPAEPQEHPAGHGMDVAQKLAALKKVGPFYHVTWWNYSDAAQPIRIKSRKFLSAETLRYRLLKACTESNGDAIADDTLPIGDIREFARFDDNIAWMITEDREILNSDIEFKDVYMHIKGLAVNAPDTRYFLECQNGTFGFSVCVIRWSDVRKRYATKVDDGGDDDEEDYDDDDEIDEADDMDVEFAGSLEKAQDIALNSTYVSFLTGVEEEPDYASRVPVGKYIVALSPEDLYRFQVRNEKMRERSDAGGITYLHWDAGGVSIDRAVARKTKTVIVADYIYEDEAGALKEVSKVSKEFVFPEVRSGEAMRDFSDALSADLMSLYKRGLTRFALRFTFGKERIDENIMLVFS